jgi:hypothetical protein
MVFLLRQSLELANLQQEPLSVFPTAHFRGADAASKTEAQKPGTRGLHPTRGSSDCGNVRDRVRFGRESANRSHGKSHDASRQMERSAFRCVAGLGVVMEYARHAKKA